ncbi:HAD-IA family hydrolase [Hoeflea sp. WL0058]|uniref:HAD-IA family hydrolase n=1 Tax=Flavimaribacter sediminis TaxID=2865987 RepID=A0AAE2ZQ52_9HYPH|nr:HAD-IA family hydrolase [Flavimaribacter sediminis]MBW8638830.1 HAD-IA family hydrolase [Flavimaribacter sediminis]
MTGKLCLMLDVDGVVVNGRPEDGLSWATDIANDLGVDPAGLQKAFFEPHWPDIVIGRKNLLDVLSACLPALAPSVTPQAFVDYWFENDSRLDDSVLADCDALRANGAAIFLASNQEHLRAKYLMDRLGLGKHVDGITYSAQIGAKKPDRAFFDAAVKRSGGSPQDLILVDDTIANVEAARAAGWRAAHWDRGSSLSRLVEAAFGNGMPQGR